MKRILNSSVLIVILVFLLSWVWEFIIEPNWLLDYFPSEAHETDVERWEYILTATSFCFIALILPTIWSLRKEKEKMQLIYKLQKALDEIKILRGIIPICSYCKHIRNDEGSWEMMEAYITENSQAEFSHGICPDCFGKKIEELEKEPLTSQD